MEAAEGVDVTDALDAIERCDLVVESVPEDLALKGEVLAPIAARFADAVIASNTSSLSIGAIGEACGAPERTVGTHYWNPPLLMPLVEVIAGAQSRPEAVELARSAVASCGKRPVLVQRDVPGFIWNRLQHALLREALWIVDNGVATPEAVDEVVRYGNARRWEHVGPFAAAALGGIGTWQRVAGELFPVLSNAGDAGDLERAQWADAGAAGGDRAARDAELARDLPPALNRPGARGRHLPSPATSLRSSGCLRSSSASAATSAGRSVSGPAHRAPVGAVEEPQQLLAVGSAEPRDAELQSPARPRCPRPSPPPRPSPCPTAAAPVLPVMRTSSRLVAGDPGWQGRGDAERAGRAGSAPRCGARRRVR